MSADDPNDDELEREAARDVPAHISNPRHSPKLDGVSRAINPRELLEAERLGQGGSTRERGPFQDFPDLEAEMERRMRERGRPEPRSPLRAVRPAPGPANVFSNPMTGNLLGMMRPPAREPETVSPDADLARAWDRYVAASLPVAVALGAEDPIGHAATFADMLLNERKRRFG